MHDFFPFRSLFKNEEIPDSLFLNCLCLPPLYFHKCHVKLPVLLEVNGFGL